MREIKDYIYEIIRDYSIEQNISQAVLEKDIFTTEIVKIIGEIETEEFDLIFCGGTCLSKAYSILERMSEDIDYKVILKVEVSSKSKLKKLLKNLKELIVLKLSENNYIMKELPISENEYKHLKIKLEHPSKLENSYSLRKELKLELRHTELLKGYENKKIGSILDEYLKDEDKIISEVKCINLEEAFLEKLIAFPRRIMLGEINSNYKDKTLVRHIYDVLKVIEKHPEILENSDSLKKGFREIVERDREYYRTTHPKFHEKPDEEIKKAFDFIKREKEIENNYKSFLEDMVYGDIDNCHSYKEAIKIFENIFSEIYFEKYGE